MDLSALKNIGLTDNEIKLYLALLQSGLSTAYDLSKKTGIYRVHVYDKLEQLMDKGLVTHVYKGAKKFFQATPPDKIRQYLDEKKQALNLQAQQVEQILPELEALSKLPKEDTHVEIFKGPEGLKYFLKHIITTLKDEKTKEVLITGIDDEKYQQTLPIFMQQYFRDLRKYRIKERVITVKKKNIFRFDQSTAPTTTYRFITEKQFNPTNTFIYSGKVVIVSWGTPVTAILIQNNEIAETYRNHFEYLWNSASTEL